MRTTKHHLIVHGGTGYVGNDRPICKTKEPETKEPAFNETAMLPIIPEDIQVNSRLKARLNCQCADCMKKPEEALPYTQGNGRRTK